MLLTRKTRTKTGNRRGVRLHVTNTRNTYKKGTGGGELGSMLLTRETRTKRGQEEGS